ncbi:glycosyltransferase [Salinibacillus xinjiangensis]|uniref:Glycosyltransferase n=2 Tax=Salinibacillus xinjiangensis TaxID=1229268 RepID=A0A6G1X1K9_9BACI|nr:glycosyltransferase [Salinibacillus xinjiangensis]
MIVKNEEKVIKRCLDSINGIVNEIIVVDTGSTDNTKAICSKYTQNIYDFEWSGSFSEARNFALSKATAKWTLVLDADEYVDRDNLIKVVQDLTENDYEKDSFAVTINNFTGVNAQKVVQHKNLRIFRNSGKIKYKRAIHEQLFREDRQLVVGSSELIIYHSGYLKGTILEKNKHKRNGELLQKEMEKTNNAFDYFNFGNEYMSEGNLEKALGMFQKAYQNKDDLGYSWVPLCVVHLVECLLHLNRFADAIEVINDAEQIWSNSPEFQTIKGIIYFNQNRFEDAKTVLNNVVKNQENYQLFIKSIDYLEYYPKEILGKIYEKELSIELAVKHYTEAYSFNKNTQVFKNLISLLAKYVTENQFISFINENRFIEKKQEFTGIIEVLMYTNKPKLIEFILGMHTQVENIEAIQLKVDLMKSDYIKALSTLDVNPNVLKNQTYFDIIDLNLLTLRITDPEYIKKMKNFMQDQDYIYKFITEPTKVLNVENEHKFKKIFMNILLRSLMLHQFKTFEQLLPLRNLFDKSINLEIGHMLYSYHIQDLAMDFYQEIESVKEYDSETFVNIIQEFRNKDYKQEALNFVIEALEHGHTDFRILVAGIEIVEDKDLKDEKKELIQLAKEYYPDSEWLKNEEAKNELSDIFL